MKKIFTLLLICIAFSSKGQTGGALYFPMEMKIQKVDTLGREIYFVQYDTATKTVTIRGDFAEAVKAIAENNQRDWDLIFAARLVMAQLTNTGTVRNRTLLTQAINQFNQVKLRYGITW